MFVLQPEGRLSTSVSGDGAWHSSPASDGGAGVLHPVTASGWLVTPHSTEDAL